MSLIEFCVILPPLIVEGWLDAKRSGFIGLFVYETLVRSIGLE